MKKVQISELKSHLSKYLREAEAGETIAVMDRAREIAHVVSVASPAELETVPAERPFASVRKRKLPRIALRVSSLQLLAAERGTR